MNALACERRGVEVKRSALACKRSGLRNPWLPLGLGLTILSFGPMARAQALAPGGAALAGQNSAVPSRITQQIDETNRVTRRGNTHPLARPRFDQGAVADSQPIRRMLLLLQCWHNIIVKKYGDILARLD